MIYRGLFADKFFCVDANDELDASRKMFQILLAMLKKDSDVFAVWPGELGDELDAIPEKELSIT